MRKAHLTSIFIACYIAGMSPSTFSHGGRLNLEGCHNQKNNLTYHCHRGPLAGQSFTNRLKAEDSMSNISDLVAQAYRRDDYFKSWGDEDGDCQDLRHELLIAQSLIDVTFTSSRLCNVSTGRWLDPYSGNLIERASDLDVDHVIPLSYAHENGGFSWPISLKQEFAQDQENLLLVTDSINQSKGARGPSVFLPEKGFQCEYVELWSRVSAKYQIELPIQDQSQIEKILKDCQHISKLLDVRK